MSKVLAPHVALALEIMEFKRNPSKKLTKFELLELGFGPRYKEIDGYPDWATIKECAAMVLAACIRECVDAEILRLPPKGTSK